MIENDYIEVDTLYDLNDMVRVDCHDCMGCADCCKGMGDTIVLDPYDCYRLTLYLGKSFDELLLKEIELTPKGGLILPNLKMAEDTDSCIFLNEEERCSIHTHRPGICRLFPLGRQYEEGGIKYFLVPGECKKENRSKMKVKKWLDTPDLKRNQSFLKAWHDLKKQLVEEALKEADEQTMKNLSLFVLNHFYRKAYQTEDFYGEFEERLQQAKAALGL
ncbi:MAG: YkgJ family cysteine cluster protein [Lachnospiraceae bacterium]|nr:YkgJ family cysteine cluster protein [Lachnospiraceae bacterium]